MFWELIKVKSANANNQTNLFLDTDKKFNMTTIRRGEKNSRYLKAIVIRPIEPKIKYNETPIAIDLM